jgi:hypothetical protein
MNREDGVPFVDGVARARRRSSANVNQNVFVNDWKTIALLIVVCIFAGAAFMLAWSARTDAKVAEMRVEGLTRALIAHGVKDTYPHLPGEDD